MDQLKLPAIGTIIALVCVGCPVWRLSHAQIGLWSQEGMWFQCINCAFAAPVFSCFSVAVQNYWTILNRIQCDAVRLCWRCTYSGRLSGFYIFLSWTLVVGVVMRCTLWLWHWNVDQASHLNLSMEPCVGWKRFGKKVVKDILVESRFNPQRWLTLLQIFATNTSHFILSLRSCSRFSKESHAGDSFQLERLLLAMNIRKQQSFSCVDRCQFQWRKFLSVVDQQRREGSTVEGSHSGHHSFWMPAS